MQFITLLDYLLLFVYLPILYFLAKKLRDKYYPEGHPYRGYFIMGWMAKLGGALGIGFIYQYYYGGGDTGLYFEHANVINSALDESVGKWFNLLLRIPDWHDGDYAEYIYNMQWYEAPAEYTVASIAAFFGLFNFTTYLPIGLIFGSLAFSGHWMLFQTFASQYPQYTRYIAIATLFIPSTIMWGSGLFKDTLCMFALGWMTYTSFRLLLKRDFSIRNILIIVGCFYLIAIIKVYILLSFVPALLLWVLFSYSHRISSSFFRNLVKMGVIAACVLGFLVFSQKFSEELGKYSLENVAQTSYVTSTYIAGMSGDDGSAYDLGDLDPSMLGMLKKMPAAINVSLFRPYIWETRKPIQFLNALEAGLFLWITIKLFIVVGISKIWKAINEDPTIQFCLIFTLIFAFAVGISSGNFGTLSRYRIPCLPFFALTQILIYYKYRPTTEKFWSFSLKSK